MLAQVEEFESTGFAVAFSPDGRFLAYGERNDVVIRDGIDWKIVHRLRGHAGHIQTLAFSPIDNIEATWNGQLASGSSDHSVRVWSLA